MRRRTAVCAVAGAVVLAALAALASGGGAEPAIADTHPGEIVDWRPPGDGWSDPVRSLVREDSIDGCGAMRALRFARETDGAILELRWAECDSPAGARSATAILGQRAGLVQAIDGPTTLLDGGQTVAHTPGLGGIVHVWAQGSSLISAYRWCGSVDPARCRAETSDDVVDAAAWIGLPVARVAAGVALRTDPLEAWLPQGGPWESEPITGPETEVCESHGSGHLGEDGQVVLAMWARCPDAHQATLLEESEWPAPTEAVSPDLLPAFGFGHDVYQDHLIEGRLSISRHWVQGDYFVSVVMSCPAGDVYECGLSSIENARSLAVMVPGAVAEAQWVRTGYTQLVLVFAVPLATLLLLHGPRRILMWRRSSGYRVPSPPDPAFEDVGPLARRARIHRFVRRAIAIVAIVAVQDPLLLLVVDTFGLTDLVDVALLFLPLVVAGIVVGILRLVWRPNPLLSSGRMRVRLTPVVAAGYAIRGTAFALAAGGLSLYHWIVIFATSGGAVGGDLVRDRLRDEALAGDLLAWVKLALILLNNTGWIAVLFFLILVLPIFLAYLLDRLGRRLTRTSVQATLASDTRPYFLYLRGFDEDDLRVEESLGRRGLIGMLTPFGRPRFEEVLVEHLTTAGPVIAISRGTSKLPDLGAAKATLGDDEWQSKVDEWVGGARAVVMSATPDQVREGLLWELTHLSGRSDSPPIVLVIAPWSRAEIERRFSAFRMATVDLPPFGELAAELPDGVHLAVWRRGDGWRAYGARRRWDWTYAAALRRALESSGV
ncbi:MAG: hypothetical protein KF727_00095 [Microbacteriaceae bacterium]|nr:hypothetical protein [Microbacteriaceae bacterium]